MALERVRDLMEQVTGAARAETVYGQAQEVAGKTIIPVAKVSYGTGGGGALGVHIQPLGVFVFSEQGEKWMPVLDVNKLALAGMGVATMALLTIRKVMTMRQKPEQRALKAAS